MNPEKRKSIIATVVLTLSVLISLVFIVYAKVKATEAEQNSMEAQAQTEIAIQEAARADILSELAQQKAAEAQMAQAEFLRLEKLLNECKNTN